MKIQSLLLFLMILPFISCTEDTAKQSAVQVPKSNVIAIQGKTMGTYYSIKVLSDKKLDKEKLKDELDKKLISFNQTFSTYKKDSELSLLNQLPKDTPKKISSDLAHVLKRAKTVYIKSNESFDVTVGPLVNAWGFGPDGKRKKPSSEQIIKLKKTICSRYFDVSPDNIFTKEIDGLYIDLSAIAKGFGVDVIYDLLQEKSFNAFLIEIGGEVRTKGYKHGNKPWVIGIEKPSEKLGSSIQKAVPISDFAMATSGSYRNFIKYGDAVFSHTIDPITGQPVKHKLVSVSVISNNCADADAWATAFMSLGPEKGIKIAEELEIPALFLLKTNNGFEEKLSKKFAIYLSETKKKKSK